MFDHSKFAEYLTTYKQHFSDAIWPDEKYKWQAVRHFQEHWDVNAADFPGMLHTALSKTDNLLASQNRFPRQMIEAAANANPAAVRAMFVNLFDESTDLAGRVAAFKQAAETAVPRREGRAHYQDENSITTYLWLRYPDKYYIYKWGLLRENARALNADFRFKRGDSASNLHDQLTFYDEICTALQGDSELRALLNAALTPDCYPDPLLKTLTIDFGYFLGQQAKAKNANKDEAAPWWPSKEEYDPGLTVDDWEALLTNPEVFTPPSLQVVARFKDIGGIASCKAVASKYGRTPSFYNGSATAAAARVLKASHAVAPKDEENGRRWPVLFTGRNALKNEEGAYVWRLRDELSEALDRVDLSGIELYEVAAPEDNTIAELPHYSKEDFLAEVFMDEEQYEDLVALLRRKKNIILQGAPGVGKTFAANRLAWSMMGEADPDRIAFVQFHQNYSYEDFMLGYKPVGDRFELQEGTFFKFCQKAAAQPDQDFFFIIDEINRGNMSKIFGELLMLIENDYRGVDATLAYGGKSLSVPPNIHIIGMMNTADRSLAMIDYALRRRFSFFEMKPGFQTKGFKKHQVGLNNAVLDNLLITVEQLNQKIAADPSLGRGFCIGHSYFCGQQSADEAWLRSIVDYDILPMLEEYWFDDEEQVTTWRSKLHGALQP